MGVICTNLANELGHHLVWSENVLLPGISFQDFDTWGRIRNYPCENSMEQFKNSSKYMDVNVPGTNKLYIDI